MDEELSWECVGTLEALGVGGEKAAICDKVLLQKKSAE